MTAGARTTDVWACGALVGGGLFCGAGASQLAGQSRWTNPLLAAALLVTVTALIAFHARYRGHYGRLGITGVVATGLGQVLQAASALGSGSGTGSGWATSAFVVGSAFLLPGLVLLTIAGFRSTLPPKWLGLVLIAGVVISGAAEAYGGPAWYGLAWIIAGTLLLRSPAAPRSDRDRVTSGP